VLSSSLVVSACTSDAEQHLPKAVRDVSFEPTPLDGSACGAVVQHHPIGGFNHVADCTPLTFAENPPASGDHYGRWAAFGEYAFALPRGYWLHNLEHGAVVWLYSCTTGCEADLVAARDLAQRLAPDSLCAGLGASEPRLIVTPDPLIDARWAASAWGVHLRADCFELEVFEAFYREHVGHGPEDVCAAGTDFRAADGGSTLPPNCG
jgi:hypothetical protein